MRDAHVGTTGPLLCLLALAPAWCQTLDPATLRWDVGPVSLRPSGFLEYVGLRRSARLGSGIQTPFASAPLGPEPEEWQASLAHSRVALEAAFQARGNWLGYYESDFLQMPGRRPYRLRQLWTEYERSGWRVLAGQGWSLLRPNRRGISSQNDLMNTLVVEPGYHVGLAGRRNRQLRITRDWGAWRAAAALESRDAGMLTLKLARDGPGAHSELLLLAGARKTLGAGFSMVVPLHRRLQWVNQQLWSQGAGPHLIGPMPARVHAHALLQGVEASLPAARLRLFAYGGAAYATRCESNRLLRQWSVGFHHALVRNGRWGTTEISLQYSRVERFTWAGGHGAMNTLAFRLRHSPFESSRPNGDQRVAPSASSDPSQRR